MSQACAANRNRYQDAANDYRKQLSAFHLRIIQTELDQNADAARIESRIASAEKEIVWLQKRPLDFEEVRKAILASRDRAVLSIRDVRKNMQHRAFKAIQMQSWLEDYVSKFDEVAERFKQYDAVEMRKRLANICDAIKNIDAGIADLIMRSQSARALHGPERAVQPLKSGVQRAVQEVKNKTDDRAAISLQYPQA